MVNEEEEKLFSREVYEVVYPTLASCGCFNKDELKSVSLYLASRFKNMNELRCRTVGRSLTDWVKQDVEKIENKFQSYLFNIRFQ